MTEKKLSQNLELLSIFHYALAALIYLKGAAAFIFIGIGTIAVAGILSESPDDMFIGLFVIGLIFYVGPIIFMCLMWTFATMVLLAGRRMARRTNLTFCQVIGGLECLCLPLGTILGIFTLIALTKPETKETFS